MSTPAFKEYSAADQLSYPIAERAPLVLGGKDFHGVTEVVSGLIERKTPWQWWVAFAISVSMLSIYGISVAYLVWNGTASGVSTTRCSGVGPSSTSSSGSVSATPAR